MHNFFKIYLLDYAIHLFCIDDRPTGAGANVHKLYFLILTASVNVCLVRAKCIIFKHCPLERSSRLDKRHSPNIDCLLVYATRYIFFKICRLVYVNDSFLEAA